jgi:hypothetical protein
MNLDVPFRLDLVEPGRVQAFQPSLEGLEKGISSGPCRLCALSAVCHLRPESFQALQAACLREIYLQGCIFVIVGWTSWSCLRLGRTCRQLPLVYREVTCQVCHAEQVQPGRL